MHVLLLHADPQHRENGGHRDMISLIHSELLFLVCIQLHYVDLSTADHSYLLHLFCLQGKLNLSEIGLAEKRAYHAALHRNNTVPHALPWKDD